MIVMIKYLVQPGDMLGVLAVKYGTTIQTLMNDNTFIPANQQLTPGWILKVYTPQENAERNADASYNSIEMVHSIESKIADPSYLTASPKPPIYYKTRLVQPGQVAFIRINERTPLMELEPNGYIKMIRTVDAGEIFGVYQIASLNGDPAFIVDEWKWIYDNSSILYDPIPSQILAGAISLDGQTSNGKMKAQVVSSSFAGFGPAQTLSSFQIAPRSFIGSGVPPKNTSGTLLKSSMPIFQQPNYRRPLMQLTNAAGETTRIELRLTGFNANYTNTIMPVATNAGWMINVRAPELPILNISGYLLETLASDEFDAFMARYHKYLEASKSGDFYSMGVSILYYKATEYRGVIVSFSYNDAPEAPLHRTYQMQMMVLREKTLTTTEINNLPSVISTRGFASQADFRSDISSMLANPITGQTTGLFG